MNFIKNTLDLSAGRRGRKQPEHYAAGTDVRQPSRRKDRRGGPRDRRMTRIRLRPINRLNRGGRHVIARSQAESPSTSACATVFSARKGQVGVSMSKVLSRRETTIFKSKTTLIIGRKKTYYSKEPLLQ